MATFSQGDFERPDIRLLQNSFVTLYFRPQSLVEEIALLKELGYEVAQFDASLWKSENDFYDAISQGLKFPNYFGRNLNALNDCLHDIEISNEAGLVVSISNFDLFNAKFRDFASAILDIIATNGRLHLLFGKRLICLVQSGDPKISFAELGAQPAVWNHREWLNKDRGL